MEMKKLVIALKAIEISHRYNPNYNVSHYFREAIRWWEQFEKEWEHAVERPLGRAAQVKGGKKGEEVKLA